MRASLDRFRGAEPLVLVVEDEETQSVPLREAIEREGIQCRVCRTAVDGYRQAVMLRPDMFVIDVNLQNQGDGFDLLEQIRQVTLAPVLILTGRATHQDDVRLAVERKATSYLHKTSAPPAVVARFVRQQLISLGKMSPAMLRLGSLILDISERRMSLDGRQISLTPMLVELSACLMEPPGGRKPAEFLAKRLYNDDNESAVISVRTHVNRLRGILEEASLRVTISGRRNFGYCFLLDGEPLWSVARSPGSDALSSMDEEEDSVEEHSGDGSIRG